MNLNKVQENNVFGIYIHVAHMTINICDVPSISFCFCLTVIFFIQYMMRRMISYSAGGVFHALNDSFYESGETYIINF